MFNELQNKSNKILKISGFTNKQLTELLYLIHKKIEFVDDDLISYKYQQKAYQLVHDIDKKDLLFVALSLQTGYNIWTGDLKLMKGLRKKGFVNILSTNELIYLIEK